MSRTSHLLLSLIAMMAFGPTLASGQSQSDSESNHLADAIIQPPESSKGILATVNGVPIGEADVGVMLRSGGHSEEIPPQHRKNVLEVIIRRELIRQRAVQLGLDSNPGYQEKLRRMEAQIDAFKRDELSTLFWRDIARKAEVSEAEAKDYFAANAVRIRTELHVWQILSRQESSIRQARNALDQGTSFEEVARGRFPKLPKTAEAPWDLGYLGWNQVPEAWRSVVYDLQKGEVSGVIQGPNNRFWIVKLIDKRENPEITFEGIMPTVMEFLKNEKIEKLHQEIEANLRAKASIVYLKSPLDGPEEE